MQPRDQTTLQDAADKHEVRLKAQLARDKSESAGSQRHHCARGKHKSPSNFGANGKTTAKDKQAGGSVTNNDIAFLDAETGHAMDRTNEVRTRGIHQEVGAGVGHRSLEDGPNPMRDMGGNGKRHGKRHERSRSRT